MKKRGDWEQRFCSFIEEARTKDFKWGTWDCCIFSDSAIQAMTGESLIPKALKWNNEEEAKVAIKSYGGSTLLRAMMKATKAKKVKQVDVRHISRGDLVVFKEESQLVGMCVGFNIIAPTDDGLAFKENTLAIKAWRI